MGRWHFVRGVEFTGCEKRLSRSDRTGQTFRALLRRSGKNLMVDDPHNPFLTVAEAAAFLRLKKRTLDNMRWMGTGPKFRKHGGRIFYHKDDLVEWSKSSRRQSTSEY